MFEQLKTAYAWTPIPGCPGRYLLSEGVVQASLAELVHESVSVFEQEFTNALDPVSYCYFEGGGLISYKKKDGYLHTLCDTDGMQRKMDMLQVKR